MLPSIAPSVRHLAPRWIAAAFAASALTLAPLAAQAPYAVGVRDLGFANPTGTGAATLTSRVHYPAAAAGTNAPILPRAGGWPVVVFLHGFAALGSNYGPLGDGLARAGFVAVMSNTAQFDNVAQERDGRALFAALVAAGQTAGNPFVGALDMGRAGLVGHSMGGGNVGNVLANNPGYRCGIGLAPVTPRGNNAALVQEPMVIVVGDGDFIAPAATYAVPYYQSLSAYEDLKVLYRMNGDCSHTNLAGFALAGTTATQVFERSLSIVLGALDRWVRDEPAGLDAVVGPPARAESRLVSLDQQVAAPQCYPAGPFTVGQQTRISVTAAPGLCAIGIAAALAPQPIATPLGSLLLDPQTAAIQFSGVAGVDQRFDAQLAVPVDPYFVGLGFAVQGLGFDRAAVFGLGNAWGAVVGG